MKISCPKGILIALSLFAASAAGAQAVNGGFESNFTSWNTYGLTQIQTSSFGVTPVEGSKQALLATALDGGLAGTTQSTIATGLGLTSTAISTLGGQNYVLGSAIGQTMHLKALSKVIFSYDFLTNQTYNDGTADSVSPTLDNNRDFGFASLALVGSPTTASVFKLTDTFDGYVADPGTASGFKTGFSITNIACPFISETGYRTYQMTVGAEGDYIVGFGAVHQFPAGGADDLVNSGILIDNVNVVPEPSALLLGLGLAGLALGRRKRSR